jgi:hypothetical protein
MLSQAKTCMLALHPLAGHLGATKRQFSMTNGG